MKDFLTLGAYVTAAWVLAFVSRLILESRNSLHDDATNFIAIMALSIALEARNK